MHHQCIISASSAHHQRNNSASTVHQQCIIRASFVRHQCIIITSPVNHQCIITASSPCIHCLVEPSLLLSSLSLKSSCCTFIRRILPSEINAGSTFSRQIYDETSVQFPNFYCVGQMIKSSALPIKRLS